MLNIYVKATEALKSLRADQAGVVSFEYVIVAASIVATVALVFGGGLTGSIGAALNNAILAIAAALIPA